MEIDEVEVWEVVVVGHKTEVVVSAGAGAGTGVDVGGVVAMTDSAVGLTALSVDGCAVMPIMSLYWEATPTGKSFRSLGSHCTVT